MQRYNTEVYSSPKILEIYFALSELVYMYLLVYLVKLLVYLVYHTLPPTSC